jgi:hypothetical protein
MDVRSPAVAGSFYPFLEEDLRSQLRDLFGYWKIDVDRIASRKRIESRGVVVPHAGYPYSGYVAARIFADIPKVNTVVLFGPNHYGMGPDFSVSSDDVWQTPLGDVDVDTKLAQEISDSCQAEPDDMAHIREHSIEVQLPFLQTVLGDFKIVPVSVKHYAPDARFLEACRDVGGAVAENAKDAFIVASTDFTHYEPQQVAENKDSTAISAIGALDEEALFQAVAKNNISMCGYGGVAATLAACKRMGAKKAEKVAYMTSGDTTGDTSQVVGYGGLRVL